MHLSRRKSRQSVTARLVAWAACLVLMGCGHNAPAPISGAEAFYRAQSDYSTVLHHAPVSSRGETVLVQSLSLDQSLALALTRDPALTTARIEAELKGAARLRSNLEQIPELRFAGNLRSETSTTKVAGIETDDDTSSKTASLSTTLDALSLLTGALAYRKASNEALVAVEALDQARLETMKNTYRQFIRNLYAQRMAAQIASAQVEINRLIQETRTARQEQLSKPIAALDTEERFVNLNNTLDRLQTSLRSAPEDLRAALFLPLNSGVRAEGDLPAPPMLGQFSAEQTERLALYALANSTSLRATDYGLRNAVLDGQIDVWSILDVMSAGLTGTVLSADPVFRRSRSENEVLSQNLVKFLTILVRGDQASLGVEAVRLERLAVTASLVTEVALAVDAYNETFRDSEHNQRIRELRAEKVRVLEAQFAEGLTSEAALVEARTKLIEAQLTSLSQNLDRTTAFIDLISVLSLKPSSLNNSAPGALFERPGQLALFAIAQGKSLHDHDPSAL